MTQTFLKNYVCHITGRCCIKNHRRPRSPDFEKLCLGKFEALFLHKSSHTIVYH